MHALRGHLALRPRSLLPSTTAERARLDSEERVEFARLERLMSLRTLG
jgi:hypothetical protein